MGGAGMGPRRLDLAQLLHVGTARGRTLCGRKLGKGWRHLPDTWDKARRCRRCEATALGKVKKPRRPRKAPVFKLAETPLFEGEQT